MKIDASSHNVTFHTVNIALYRSNIRSLALENKYSIV